MTEPALLAASQVVDPEEFLAIVLVAAVARDVMEQRERLALAFFQSTQLPLVLAITTLARENGEMSASTAAALVCAAVLSTLFFPLLGLRLRTSPPKRVMRSGVPASTVPPWSDHA
jgi:hypothetical protein